MVEEELARAVRTESSLALQYWFGVSSSMVHDWRQALGVGQWDTPGSPRLHQAVSAAGAEQ